MTNSLRDYGVFNAQQFVGLDIPPRKPLMGHWLVEKSITLLYADRGVGKSNFALGLAVALAKGEDFLGFSNNQKTRVLFLDGEMPAHELQRRLKSLCNGDIPKELTVCSASQAFVQMESLANEEGQHTVECIADSPEVQSKVLIIDNKSTLMAVRRENDADSWIECQNWLIRLRNAGYAVILVHHAGKSGAQRGSSMAEVTPDIILKLEKTASLPDEQSSQFVLRFEKNRHLVGSELNPKLITLRMDEDSTEWSAENTIDKPSMAKQLHSEGLTQRQIASEMGCAPSSVNSYLRS